MKYVMIRILKLRTLCSLAFYCCKLSALLGVLHCIITFKVIRTANDKNIV